MIKCFVRASKLLTKKQWTDFEMRLLLLVLKVNVTSFANTCIMSTRNLVRNLHFLYSALELSMCHSLKKKKKKKKTQHAFSYLYILL